MKQPKNPFLQHACLNERAATMIEYALMVALIAVVAIAAVTFLGEQASETFTQVGTTIQTAREGDGGGDGGGD